MHRIARGLGGFSLVLGLGDLLGGERLDDVFGTRDRRNLYRVFSLCEIATGAGSSPRGTRPLGFGVGWPATRSANRCG